MTSVTEFSILAAAIAPVAPASCPTSFDPVKLSDLAEFHRVVPLVHRYLHACGSVVPQRLTDAAQSNARHNLLLFSHTCSIVDALRANGIDALALKGPVLAFQLYGDLGLRTSVDVDVLVPRAEFVRAASLVGELGYQSDIGVAANAIRGHLVRQHDLGFAHKDGTLIELHAGIAQPHYSYEVDLIPWFRAAVDVEISGRSVRTLSPAHAATFAIIHGTKHVWSRLDLVSDVAGFGGTAVDWDEVARTLGAMGARRAGAVAVELARVLASWSVPAELADTKSARIARRISRRIESGETPTYWQSRVYDLTVRERFSDRARYLARLGLKLPV